MIRFEKVSFSEWEKSGDFDQKKESYEKIKLPRRATKGSAGYDFYSVWSFDLKPNETKKMPTGIRCKMDDDVVLQMHIRSSIGFKYQTTLDNCCGIIDSDYYNSENEGHIFVKFTNHGVKTLHVEAGDAICQGIFVKYLLTDDDDTTEIRVGGIGSTNKK